MNAEIVAVRAHIADVGYTYEKNRVNPDLRQKPVRSGQHGFEHFEPFVRGQRPIRLNR